MRYFIELAFNGKQYHGWQNQPDAITVQEVLEDALSKLLRETIAIVGAGRTDAGVHASQMYAHFDTEYPVDENLIYKLNAFLPKSIAIYNIWPMQPEAHARFDAKSRSYIYKISTRKDPFNAEFAYYFKKPLHVEAMKTAAQILLEYKDFQCFSRSNTDVKTYHCDVKKVEWRVTSTGLEFEIQADRFLRNMVRAIVGTLLEIGLGKLQIQDMHDIIASKNRSNAGPSAPAHGLYLTQIEYPKTLFIDG